MHRRLLSLLLAAAGLAGLATAAIAAAADDDDEPELTYRTFVPAVTRAEPEPTPTPTPPPPPPRVPVYDGPVTSLYLKSAGVLGGAPLQVRDTVWQNGRETFQDPSQPQYIAHYGRFGHPGNGATNSLFAAHINYVGYGAGPFAKLLQAKVGDALYVKMANGVEYAYTVKSVTLVPLAQLDMNPVVYPGLDIHTERVTLISCGGTLIPRPGGGEYDGRVILVAERWVP